MADDLGASEATSEAMAALRGKQAQLVSKQNQRVRLQQQVESIRALENEIRGIKTPSSQQQDTAPTLKQQVSDRSFSYISAPIIYDAIAALLRVLTYTPLFSCSQRRTADSATTARAACR